MGWAQYFTFTTSPLKIKCVNGNGFIARGLDDPEKLKALDDVNVAWFEECDRITYNAYDTLSTTLRSSKVELVEEFHTFNSTSKNSFYVKEFFPKLQTFERADGQFTEVESTRDDTYIIHTTFTDNEFITKQRADKLLNKIKTNPEKARVDVFGLFGLPKTGLIYPTFNVVSKPERIKDYCIGIDYGASTTAIVQVWIDEENKKFFAKELHFGKLHSAENIMNILEVNGIEKTSYIYTDHNEKTINERLRENGYNIHLANKDVWNGIGYVQEFEINLLYGSDNLIEQMESYIWKTDRFGNNVNAPVKHNDHCPDAIRYAIYTGRQVGNLIIPKAKVRKFESL